MTLPDVSQVPACTCEECAAACQRRVGWFTPDEADRALGAGLAKFMALDYYMGHVLDDIDVLAPAWLNARNASDEYGHLWSPDVLPVVAKDGDIFVFESNGGQRAPYGFTGVCAFFHNGLCLIHESGFKPYECRAARHCDDRGLDGMDIHYEVPRKWNTPYGKGVIGRWKELVDYSIVVVSQ